MSDILDVLALPETIVVFDIDGVLAPYEFGDLCHSACPDEDWKSYVLNEQPYSFIRPVPRLQRFIERKSPSTVYACSVADDYEEEGKRQFVLDSYEIPEDHIVFVRSKKEKPAFLRRLAQELDVPERRIALVDDAVATLDQAMEETGCMTVHVSSFLFA